MQYDIYIMCISYIITYSYTIITTFTSPPIIHV